jgi:hypothetical protein
MPTPPRIITAKRGGVEFTMGPTRRVYNSLPGVCEFWNNLNEMARVDLVRRSNKPLKQTHLGRLSLKEEAAGKIRVFAIVDCWTQWMLNPLHKAIFALLGRIPQDGTFDQHAPVKRLRLTKRDFVASFDLSAATDRLPLQIQKIALGPVLGLHLAET